MGLFEGFFSGGGNKEDGGDGGRYMAVPDRGQDERVDQINNSEVDALKNELAKLRAKGNERTEEDGLRIQFIESKLYKAGVSVDNLK